MSNYDSFREQFSLIEKALRKLNNEPTGSTASFGLLLDRTVEKSKLVRSLYDELRIFVDIRNILEHNIDSRKAIEIPESTVIRIKKVYETLTNPPNVLEFINRGVSYCQKTDQIDVVLKAMVDNDFSQVPVLDKETFYGLLTTNTIARWLGKELLDFEMVISETNVDKVMQHSENLKNYKFVSRKANLFEIVEIFAKETESKDFFDAILISETGKENQKILGIITKSDLPEIILSTKRQAF